MFRILTGAILITMILLDGLLFLAEKSVEIVANFWNRKWVL